MSRIEHLLIDKVCNAFRSSGLTYQGRNLIAAISGGMDSMALLKLLHAISKQMHFTIVVCHVDHGLREDSKVDAEFVEEKAEKGGYAFELCLAPEKPEKVNLEAWARAVRYQFLEEVRSKYDASCVVTAHHLNDEVETHLFRLFTGRISGNAYGISAFSESRKVLRPLLQVPRLSLKKYAEQKGLEWVEDASNSDLTLSRNRIRHELIPNLSSYNPRVIEAIGEWSERLGKDEELLSEMAMQKLQELARPIKRDNLLGLSHALSWRVLLLYLKEHLGRKAETIGYKRLKSVLISLEKGKKTNGEYQLGREISIRNTARDDIQVIYCGRVVGK